MLKTQPPAPPARTPPLPVPRVPPWTQLRPRAPRREPRLPASRCSWAPWHNARPLALLLGLRAHLQCAGHRRSPALRPSPQPCGLYVPPRAAPLRASTRLFRQSSVPIVSKLLNPFMRGPWFSKPTYCRCCRTRTQLLPKQQTHRFRKGEIARGNAGLPALSNPSLQNQSAESVTGRINPMFPCCQSCAVRVPFNAARFCYPEPCNWS